MPHNKYDILNETDIQQKASHDAPHDEASLQSNVAISDSKTQTNTQKLLLQSPQGAIPAGGQSIASKEHTTGIMALITYTVDKENTDLVRIYDGVIAQRDGAFLVERKFLANKTPEQIHDYYSLTFVPKLICDALVPVGHQILMGKLTNSTGKRVSIYQALTALNLFSERNLTPENLSPTQPALR